MESNNPKQILIVPLDWGLGHTTRCVPLIRYLQQLGHHITVGGNEWQRKYITETFPGIETIHLDGYNVSYSKHGKGFMFAILQQIPKLLRNVRKEHEWLIELSEKRKFDGIISDNRYGLFHPTIPSVIMTHQVLAQTGMGNTADSLLRRLHYRFLTRFGQCWVVDVPGIPNLSGKLGHPSPMPRNAKFAGLLSQIIPNAHIAEDHLLVLLSGPEPQRTMLSHILWEQLKDHKGKVVFVEGSDKAPRQANNSTFGQNGRYFLRITKDSLQPLIEDASIVICRSGYSTLMDLAVLYKKAILIPTPGQTEQEYLGKHLHKEGVFFHAPQKNFDLQHALTDAQLFPFKKLELHGAHELYKGVVEEWVKSL
ncbi:glycosyltransferase [Polluticoccus soli]|uniref:glycosyltransferase n=1 Tax=Polluticoccus soli TaxID=3034150 RepID=UPI0023E18B7C|nr:glycosyltransferase [Flavipsychrobacter sp. JY13-12]